MTTNEITYQIQDLAGLEQYSTIFATVDSDYLISRMKEAIAPVADDKIVRFNGISVILNVKGISRLVVNTEEIPVTDSSLIFIGSSSTIKVVEANSNDVDAYLLFLTPEFVGSVNLDLNVLQQNSMVARRSPILQLSKEKTDLLGHYMEMLFINAKANPHGDIFTKNISRSLIAALFYQIMLIANKTQSSQTLSNKTKDLLPPAESDAQKGGGTRRITYAREFFEMVKANYTRERSITFYASALCISPKYLSNIIKEITGRPASEWIDEFVILEAKNMIRFSGMNIQQVAYALNFNNQSAFGKYFKNLTGMSPSQFQKN